MDAVEAEDAVPARPYRAVVSEVPGVEVYRVEGVDEKPVERHHGRRGETYVTDIPIGLVAAGLAGVTFLPWYKGPSGFGISATGWASGTWGPLILFLAAGSVILVLLRRLGVAVSLPIEESLFHEGAGWIALVGAVVKSRARPGTEGLLTTSYGAWIAIGLAVVLIVLAGRMSPHAPLVFRPGWHKARAGIIGIVVLAVVVAGSAVFGATNKAKLTQSSRTPPGLIQGRIPNCAKGFPLPAGLKPQSGFDGSLCQAVLTSPKASTALATEVRDLLKQKKYTFSEVPAQPGYFIVTKPVCVTVVVVPSDPGSLVALAYNSCQPIPTSPARR
jgi:hypothetical protein